MERNAAWRPRAALLAAAVCVISARCGGTPRGAPSGEPTDRAAADTGFVATVTGAVQGKVAAPGVVKRLESDGGYTSFPMTRASARWASSSSFPPTPPRERTT